MVEAPAKLHHVNEVDDIIHIKLSITESELTAKQDNRQQAH